MWFEAHVNGAMIKFEANSLAEAKYAADTENVKRIPPVCSKAFPLPVGKLIVVAFRKAA